MHFVRFCDVFYNRVTPRDGVRKVLGYPQHAGGLPNSTEFRRRITISVMRVHVRVRRCPNTTRNCRVFVDAELSDSRQIVHLLPVVYQPQSYGWDAILLLYFKLHIQERILLLHVQRDRRRMDRSIAPPCITCYCRENGDAAWLRRSGDII